MSVTAADIQALPSGEFASVSSAVLDRYIAQATRRWRNSYITGSDSYDDIILYGAAHLYALDAQGGQGSAGPVIGSTVGPVSVSFGASYVFSSRKPSDLDQTIYGQRLKAILSGLGLRMTVA